MQFTESLAFKAAKQMFSLPIIMEFSENMLKLCLVRKKYWLSRIAEIRIGLSQLTVQNSQ